MSDEAEIHKAAQIIQNGGVVAFPTETVYGLGADATDEEACQKIFKTKGRPSINPLIVHVKNLAQAQEHGIFNEDAIKLAQVFWPGPLTIVLPYKVSSGIAPCVLAGNDTIALRVPSHELALELISRSSRPLAAPSANPSGYITSTLKSHVVEHFGNDVFILGDDKTCEYGLESTIIDLSIADNPTVLRYGFITPDSIEKMLGKELKTSNSLMQIKAPGMMDKHYSPHCRVRLNALSLNENEVGLNYGNNILIGKFSLNLSESGDITEAASNLYKMLKTLDKYCLESKNNNIAVAAIPDLGIGLAINDRLRRASCG